MKNLRMQHRAEWVAKEGKEERHQNMIIAKKITLKEIIEKKEAEMDPEDKDFKLVHEELCDFYKEHENKSLADLKREHRDLDSTGLYFCAMWKDFSNWIKRVVEW